MIFVILAPIETNVIPQWTGQVVDVSGNACANMRVTQIGGWTVDAAVWAAGIKDVAWLSYVSGRALPGRMRVEKCFVDGAE